MTKPNNKETILAIDRLVLFIKTNNISQTKFQRSIGVSSGYISNQLRRRGSISSDILNKILLQYPELNVIWLLTGHSLIIPRYTLPNQAIETALVAS